MRSLLFPGWYKGYLVKNKKMEVSPVCLPQSWCVDLSFDSLTQEEVSVLHLKNKV